MSPPRVVIDTDLLSAIMRRNPIVSVKAKSYLDVHKRFTISIITRYEILRGLKAKSASKQAAAFGVFCAQNVVLPITDDIIVRAADIYADLHKRGELIGDADILIAATAQVNGHGVVSNNESHFSRVRGLVTENWLK